MNMVHWWNDTDREKPKYSEKNLTYHWAGIELGPSQWEAGEH
jgi:hypothetical protein